MSQTGQKWLSRSFLYPFAGIAMKQDDDGNDDDYDDEQTAYNG